jgi:hypothetical protein
MSNDELNASLGSFDLFFGERIGTREQRVQNKRRERLSRAHHRILFTTPGTIFLLGVPQIFMRLDEGSFRADGVCRMGRHAAEHQQHRGMKTKHLNHYLSASCSVLVRLAIAFRNSESFSVARHCTTAAVQNTGLVMQWWPLQLPSPFCTFSSRSTILPFHI